jgi:hypothetical protein
VYAFDRPGYRDSRKTADWEPQLVTMIADRPISLRRQGTARLPTGFTVGADLKTRRLCEMASYRDSILQDTCRVLLFGACAAMLSLSLGVLLKWSIMPSADGGQAGILLSILQIIIECCDFGEFTDWSHSEAAKATADVTTAIVPISS